jgi:ABC-type multidrug transport system ATPase subunit
VIKLSTIIKIENLKKHYNHGTLKALDGVNVTIEKGKIYGLIGPNGAGKTTFVKLILGATFPTEGSVHINEFKAGSVDAYKLIGYVCEKNAIPMNESLYEYLFDAATLSGIKHKDIPHVINEKLEEWDLVRFKEAKLKSFSSGMKKKAQIIAALLTKPEILILDEPTANLDPVVRFEIIDYIKDLSDKYGVTIILCSHNLDELEKIIDNVIMINKGKLIVSGSYHEIMHEINENQTIELKTANDALFIEHFKAFDYVTFLNQAPLVIETSNIDAFQEEMFEFMYHNRVMIKELNIIKRSLFEIFEYFSNNPVKEDQHEVLS